MEDALKYEYKVYKMFKHGCKFYDCAIMCQDVHELREHFDFKVPEIVNMAFSCEVFLKTIIVIEGKKVKGHKLKELWNELNPCYAQMIMDELKSVTELEQDDILASIENISNAFAEWRYLYEVKGRSIYIGFLNDFAWVLREQVCKILYRRTYDEYKGV